MKILRWRLRKVRWMRERSGGEVDRKEFVTGKDMTIVPLSPFPSLFVAVICIPVLLGFFILLSIFSEIARSLSNITVRCSASPMCTFFVSGRDVDLSQLCCVYFMLMSKTWSRHRCTGLEDQKALDTMRNLLRYKCEPHNLFVSCKAFKSTWRYRI
jgi:hypothetical protein